MRLKTLPADFAVVERLRNRPSPKGAHAIYRIRKHNATTLTIQREMARRLHVSHSAVVFPALKDKRSIAVQHASVQASAPRHLDGDQFEARLVGYMSRPLTPTDIESNGFSVVVRDLSGSEAQELATGIDRVGETGLPNYFGQQRFGSMTPGRDHIAKRILLRDAEGALRAYLTHPFSGDPKHVRSFKTTAAAIWGDWQAMFEAAPRPSNFRSVLTYMRDHPPVDDEPGADTIYRKALNLIPQRLLSLYLTAYQSLLWNRIAARLLANAVGFEQGSIRIAREKLPLYKALPADFDRRRTIPLPHHRASYGTGETAAVAELVFGAEALELNELKPRILKKAYLPRGERSLLLFPQEASAGRIEPDELFRGRRKVKVSFALPRGCYATLVLRTLAESEA